MWCVVYLSTIPSFNVNHANRRANVEQRCHGVRRSCCGLPFHSRPNSQFLGMIVCFSVHYECKATKFKVVNRPDMTFFSKPLLTLFQYLKKHTKIVNKNSLYKIVYKSNNKNFSSNTINRVRIKVCQTH